MPRLRSAKPVSARTLVSAVRVRPLLILKPLTNTDARRLRLRHSQLGRALAKPVRVCLWFITISASVQSSSFCPFLQRVLQRTIHKNILVFSTHTILPAIFSHILMTAIEQGWANHHGQGSGAPNQAVPHSRLDPTNGICHHVTSRSLSPRPCSLDAYPDAEKTSGASPNSHLKRGTGKPNTKHE